MPGLTLADMVILNDVSITDMGATDIFNDAPVLRELSPIVASHGTDHKFRKDTTAPTVGFRAPGAGRARSKTGRVNTTVGLQILDASFDLESALADSDPRGADHVLAMEALSNLAQALKVGEKQLFYGLGNDAGGFNGLADSMANLAAANVVPAGTPTTGQSLTDVWMIRTTPDEKFLNVCVGNKGKISVGDTYQQMLVGSNSLERNCYVTPIEGWMTLILHSSKSAARLCNIDDATSKLTDALLAALYEQFDENNPPTHVIMNKRSGRQLRTSRVATTNDGSYVPLPKDWDGIPIIYTNSIGYYAYASRLV